MAYSQNGYAAQNARLIAQYTVPGTSIKANLRKGDVSVVLLYLMGRYHREVEPLRAKDTGSYNPRSIIGGRTLSNHASGTAVDLRWNDHGLGRRGTFSNAQVTSIQRILTDLNGIVRWGGNYKGRADEMHFEIIGNPAQVKAVADKIRAGTLLHSKPPTKKPQPKPNDAGTLEKGDSGATVKQLQRDLNRVFRSYSKLAPDGKFGPATERVVKEFQRRVNIEDDGVVGPTTKRKLRVYGIHVRG